jgi:hypothetical protein
LKTWSIRFPNRCESCSIDFPTRSFATPELPAVLAGSVIYIKLPKDKPVLFLLPAVAQLRMFPLRASEPNTTPEKPTPEIKPPAPPEIKPASEPELPPVAPTETEPETLPEISPENPPEIEPDKTPDQEPEINPPSSPEIQPGSEPEITPTAPPEIVPENPPEISPQRFPEINPTSPPELRLDLQSPVKKWRLDSHSTPPRSMTSGFFRA